MNIYTDKRVVMTLDAGGTNFVFTAIKEGKEIVSPIALPSNASNLDDCLNTIITGFEKLKSRLSQEPVAISFAFPGPADYINGVLGDLPNFSSFRGGVALKALLEREFQVPVIISNDGDLFAYGEAVAGFLPEINRKLKENNVAKKFRNLIGITLGTGFGCGLVVNNSVCLGDNSAAGEMWTMRNFREPHLIAEEGVSIRGIQRYYNEIAGTQIVLAPKEIHEIALGVREGNKDAAIKAFEEMAIVIAEALANAITLIDGAVVIGGGISGASNFLLPKIVEHLNGTIGTTTGGKIPRLVSRIFNVEDEDSYGEFLNSNTKKVTVPFSNELVDYNPHKNIPIGISRLGTSQAICLGAYAIALSTLDEMVEIDSQEWEGKI